MIQEENLIRYTLHLADNALILGHRNSEWTGHGPILEQDIAISNIALDLVGQARNFYQYAASLLGEYSASTSIFHEGALLPGIAITEDHLAYLRDTWDFSNCLLVEQPNGDWAHTILRQFLFSTYQLFLYDLLRSSGDSQLAAIAEKSYKETAYHFRWSAEWVIRLGDGTGESRRRMEKALDACWKFSGELFLPASFETNMAAENRGVDLALIRPLWEEKVQAVFAEAGLSVPGQVGGPAGGRGTGASTGVTSGDPTPAQVRTDQAGVLSGGKQGRHTEHLGYILAEMQFLQRAYPNCEW